MTELPQNIPEDINLLLTYFGIGIEALVKTSDKIRKLNLKDVNYIIEHFDILKKTDIKKRIGKLERKFSKLNEEEIKNYIKDLNGIEEEQKELEPIVKIKSESSESFEEEIAIPEYYSEYNFVEQKDINQDVGMMFENEGGIKRQNSSREEVKKFRIPLETESKMISKPEIIEMNNQEEISQEGIDLSAESQEGIDLSAESQEETNLPVEDLREKIEENIHKEELEKITPKDSVIVEKERSVTTRELTVENDVRIIKEPGTTIKIYQDRYLLMLERKEMKMTFETNEGNTIDLDIDIDLVYDLKMMNTTLYIYIKGTQFQIKKPYSYSSIQEDIEEEIRKIIEGNITSRELKKYIKEILNIKSKNNSFIMYTVENLNKLFKKETSKKTNDEY